MNRPVDRSMAHLLVSDTSVLIDLERGKLLQTTFKLPAPLAVTDLLYERELRATNGELLVTLGLQVLALDDAAVTLAQAYMARAPGAFQFRTRSRWLWPRAVDTSSSARIAL